MKNTKNMLLSIASVVALMSTSVAMASGAPGGSFAPVVEIYNKGTDSIQVNIADIGSGSGRKDIATAYVSGDQQWNSGSRVIDWNNKLLIEILKQNKLIARFSINAPGKTKYMSYDSAKKPSLYPQTGPLFGLMGKTKSGLSLSNNVKASDITQMN